MSDILKVAVIQMDCCCGNVRLNLEKAGALLKEAKAEGAELAVLPELFNVGYELEVLKGLEYNYAETLDIISRLSKELNMYIVAGVLEKLNHKYYNSALVFDNQGNMVDSYRKINLFPLGSEKEIFEPGVKPVTFNLGHIKFGVMICYDIRFPELGRRYFQEGCDALLVVSAFPLARKEHWNTLIRARAIENQSYVLAANRCGMDGKTSFAGNSCMVDPWGNVTGALDSLQEAAVVQTMDLKECSSVRALFPIRADKQRLDSVLSINKKRE